MKGIYKCKALFLAAFLLVSVIIFAGCGGSLTVDEEQSPNLVNAVITSYNEGSESEQYVQVVLEFDREISVREEKEDSLRITIAQERVQSDEYTLTQGEDSDEAVLTISVTAITNGVLYIEKSESADVISDIMDADGQYAANDFTLEGLIPSGMTLSDVSSDDVSVTKQVASLWNIRSIAWVCLTKDGEVLPVEEEDADEELDGYVAVHGHEFLTDDDTAIAENIAESLSRVYSSEDYAFSSEGNQVTATAVNGETGVYDIQVYQYLRIDGEEVALSDAAPEEDDSGDSEDADDEEEHELVKLKEPEINRDPSAEEQAFIDKLHISQLGSEELPDGGEIYSTVTITGDAMSEEEVYSVRDFEDLIELSYENESMNAIGLPRTVSLDGNTYYGIDLVKFLELCEVDIDAQSLYMKLETDDGGSEIVDLAALIAQDAGVTLVFADEAEPLHETSESLTGPVACICGSASYGGVNRITLSGSEDPTDPEYRFHNREPWSEDLDQTFTVEVYKNGAEYLGALTTKTYTTADLEQLMRDHPDQVVGGYFGTNGNSEIYQYMGTGGWLDYFEGIDLYWLLTEDVGVESLDGHAELYDRYLESYGTIDNLAAYFNIEEDADYYVLTSDGIRETGVVPAIACTKNGYPILPEHEHESSGYIAYNVMNLTLDSLGIETEVGVVKNHNGPFIACLPNLDGVYGGNQVETGADCCLIRLYVD
ncbi:MAG: hypothetical protein LUF32_09305 [Clostridiales bacterium]|nr:hypothetical protein [Clostridiales bacterium]